MVSTRIPSAQSVAANGFERRRLKSRTAIVEAAIELFQSQGVHETSVDDICERAEVSVRTFFNHFETREHLHDHIASQRAAEAADVLRHSALDPRPFSVRLADFVEGIADYLAERPAYRDFVGEMLQRHPARGYEAVRAGVLFDGVRTLVASGLERAEIDASMSADSLADVIVGAVVVLTANWSADDRFDVRGEATETVRVLLRMCGSQRD